MKKNVLIVILILIIIALGGTLFYQNVLVKEESEKDNKKEVKDEIKEEVKKYTSYTKGNELTLSDGSKWMVLADSDENQDYVVLLSNQDYSTSITENDDYNGIFSEISNSTTQFENSKLKMYLDSKVNELPVELKEVNGYKIRLITIEEIFSFDDKWDYESGYDIYYYKGKNLNENFMGILTMSHTKCNEGKCNAFYNLGQTQCYTEECEKNKEIFLEHWMSGLGGIKPVINVSKDSISE